MKSHMTCTRVRSLVERALSFATLAHGDQRRKYTGELYIVHPIEVMEIVKTVPHDEAMLAAALLHDVVEDTKFSLNDIKKNFGNEISHLVDGVTKISVFENTAGSNSKVEMVLEIVDHSFS